MDASLPEFLLLFVIGLLVLGPERMAQVAKKIGHFVGYARRMSRNFQVQLEDELEMKQIRATPVSRTVIVAPAAGTGAATSANADAPATQTDGKTTADADDATDAAEGDQPAGKSEKPGKPTQKANSGS